VTGEAEATDAPTDVELRRNLRSRGNRRDRHRGDNDVTSDSSDDDSTREPKDGTREPRGRKNRGNDSTREPCDDDKVDVTGEAEATDAPTDVELRRNLRSRGNRRDRHRGDNDVTSDSSDDNSTREPKDGTREPRKRRTREQKDATREPCDEDEDATEAPVLRRLLRRGGCGDSTREPKDVTREPCVGDDCRRGKGRGDSDDSSDESTDAPIRRLLRGSEESQDSTKEPCDRTREPCVGDDCDRQRKGRKGGRKSRKGEDATTEAPEDVPELRRALGQDGRKRSKGLGATISNGIVDIAGVTGEVVFGEVDQVTQTIPLTLTIGESTFQCDVGVQRGNKVSCVGFSNDDFKVRIGCEL